MFPEILFERNFHVEGKAPFFKRTSKYYLE